MCREADGKRIRLPVLVPRFRSPRLETAIWVEGILWYPEGENEGRCGKGGMTDIDPRNEYYTFVAPSTVNNKKTDAVNAVKKS